MIKTLFISHGGKGGVGKSYMACAGTEAMLAAGCHVTIVEADPTQPDVAARYLNDPNVTVGALSLNRAGDAENSVSEFGEWLEQKGGDHVIVNLPAGAGETLDLLGDQIRYLADGLGYRLIATYSLEKNRVATEEMVESFQSGLMSHVAPEDRFIIIPAYKGNPETFEWMTHPARETIGAHEIVFPALGSRSALKKLEATPGRISHLIVPPYPGCDGWMLLDKSSVFRWHKAVMTAMAPIFGGE
ncbi:MAG: hypothetical protein M0Z76_09100 [Gammaproteobacteria bacterium]|nr:hypothetical protein [Gammaproteobacteria bacterium]